MKRFLCLMFLLPLFAKTQVTSAVAQEKPSTGIQWTEGLSWMQILKKAKKENKYIFLDCFATWCGPCKWMEKNTFLDNEVGAFFNEHFISVRVQMDKTKNDDEQVRNWYSSAAAIGKEHGIPAYPTFLFFSPQGKLVNRDVGLKYRHQFLPIAKKAIEPGMTAPYRGYYSLLANYQLGTKDYTKMAGLADTAKLLGQDDIAADVSKEYRAYLQNRNEAEWYSTSNLSFMANFIQGSKDPFFAAFYMRGTDVDSILRKKGFSKFIVGKIIKEEEIEPVAKPVKGIRSSNEKPSVEKEPDWIQLEKQIASKYTSEYAGSNVLYERIQWYIDHHDWAKCAKTLTMAIKKYKIEYSDGNMDVLLNVACWDAVFKRSVDKEQIDAAIECMKDMIKRENDGGGAPASNIDTYANLLYKAGRVQEAIQQEEEALKKDNKKSFHDTLDRMKQGKPTWPHYVSTDFWDNGLVD